MSQYGDHMYHRAKGYPQIKNPSRFLVVSDWVGNSQHVSMLYANCGYYQRLTLSNGPNDTAHQI